MALKQVVVEHLRAQFVEQAAALEEVLFGKRSWHPCAADSKKGPWSLEGRLEAEVVVLSLAALLSPPRLPCAARCTSSQSRRCPLADLL
jgi:hypothetical protein